MKILFLDIDEVLCTVASRIYHKKKRDGYKIDTCPSITAILAYFLKRLNDQLEVRVVIISARVTNVHDKKLRNRINWDCGVRGYLHDDWCVRKVHGTFRGNEVAEWLSRHPEVSDFICIDDSSDYYEYQPLVNVNGYVGLTLAELCIIEHIFTGRELEPLAYDLLSSISITHRTYKALMSKDCSMEVKLGKEVIPNMKMNKRLRNIKFNDHIGELMITLGKMEGNYSVEKFKTEFPTTFVSVTSCEGLRVMGLYDELKGLIPINYELFKLLSWIQDRIIVMEQNV